jgi:hypothetical protein
MELVGPDEMHLARQAGVVARAAQVVGERGDGGRELGGVVVDARPARQLPGRERGARRQAERRRRVSIHESRRTIGQRLQVRRVQEVGRPVRKERAAQLVDHDDEDVGAALGHR